MLNIFSEYGGLIKNFAVHCVFIHVCNIMYSYTYISPVILNS